MKRSKPPFTLFILITAATTGMLIWYIGSTTDQFTYGTGTWLSQLFLLLMTFVVHRLLLKAQEKRPQLFVVWYMGTITGKLLLSAIILLICGIMEPAHLWLTSLSYLAAYFAYTILELKTLLFQNQ